MTPSRPTVAPIWKSGANHWSWVDLGRVLAVAVLVVLGSRARAATIWWDGTGNDWSALSSWGNAVSSTTDPVSIPGAADFASFSIATVITAQTVNLGAANQSALGLEFLGTNTSATLLQAGGTDRTLTLGTSGITVNALAGAVTIGSATAGQNVAVTMSGAQSWTNNSANTLTIENAVANGGFLLTAAGSGDTTINGAINGSGGLAKDGTGTLTLSAPNTYTGGTTVQNGTLVFVDNHSGSSNFSTLSPGTLEFNVTSGQQQLSGGAITGNGTVVKSGAGELWLGANGITQSISMSGGLIDVQGGLLRNEWGRGDWTGNKASLRVGSGATVDLWDSPGGITVDALTGSGVVTHTSYGGAENFTVGVNNGSGTFAGTITNQSGFALNLVKDGTGTQTLTGPNTYTGGTTVQNGTLVFVDNHSGSSNFSTLSPGTLEFNVTSGQQQLSGGAITGNGTVVKSGAGELWLGANGITQSISMSGGLIDVQGGLLRNEWGRGDWTGNKASLRVGSGATVDLWDSPGGITVDALTGSGVVTHTSYGGAENFTVGVNNGSGTFAGTITNQSGFALNLVKDGTGTQTLTGANSYTGASVINGGELEVGAGGSLTGTGNIMINSGGTLLLSGAGPDKINNSAAIDLNGGTIAMGGSTSLNEQVGVLTLSASSTIDFGTFSGGHILRFADSSAAMWGAFTLNIWNWTVGVDHLYFGSVFGAGLPGGGLAKIRFYTDGGTTPAGGSSAFYGPDSGEVFPLPEPSTVLVCLSLLSLAGYRERRWLFRCREARQKRME